MIRPALPSDEAAIRTVAVAAYTRYIPAMGREPAPMVADFGAAIAAGRAYVTEDASGFIVFYPQGEAMMLENVAVHPDHAGRGIGRALIDLCETRAREAGLGAVVLYTNAAMTENLALYPRLGYARTGRRVEDGFDRVYFRKAVPPLSPPDRP